MAGFAVSCDPNSCGSMHASKRLDAMCSMCAHLFRIETTEQNETRQQQQQNMLGSLLLTKRIELLFKKIMKNAPQR